MTTVHILSSCLSAEMFRRRYSVLVVVSLLCLCMVLQSLMFKSTKRDIEASTQGLELAKLRLRNALPSKSTSKDLDPRKVKAIHCRRLFEGDENEQEKAAKFMRENPRSFPSDMEVHELAKNCSRLLDQGYNLKAGSKEEANYSIAFSILLHKDAHQMERLLRMIYQPQNYYCLHVDKKVNNTLHDAAKAIADCFPNVMVASDPQTVIYASFSRLQAEFNCMKDMLRIGKEWKYYINLVSSVLPLRTNREMVEILKIYNGANDVEGLKNVLTGRISHSHVVKGHQIIKTAAEKSPPPHNINIVKGSAYGIFSRNFVTFLFNDSRVQDFIDWSRDTFSPDEHVWSTLNSLHKNPHLHTPGGYKGPAYEKPWLATYASWGGQDPCYSQNSRHSICIFGIKDLPQLINRKEFFANKFDPDFEYLGTDCIEEMLHYRNTFDVPMHDWFYYKKLPFIIKKQRLERT